MDKRVNKLVVDPPMGSRFGFPRVFDKREDETDEEWFLRRGYPKELIEQGMLKHCRWWDWKPDKKEEESLEAQVTRLQGEIDHFKREIDIWRRLVK